MRFLVLSCMAFCSSTALAAPINTTPPWRSYQETGNPADIIQSPTVAQAIGNKVDATNGQAQGMRLSGGILQGPTLDGGITIAGNGEIPFVPKGSPLPGSVGSTVARINLGLSGVQNFGDNTECTSSAVAPALGGNVCQYVWLDANASSGQTWARNLVLQLESGFQTSKYSALGDEIDINNLAGDYDEFGAANGVGLLFNGLGKINTAAISVQTGNSATGMTGTAGQLAIWYYGFHTGPNSIYQAAFDERSSAVYGWLGRGANTYGASYADDNTSAAAILLGNLGPRQGIVGRNGNTQYSMMYMDTAGSIHIGNITQANWQSDGNILPVSDDMYSLGSPANRWANINTENINGISPIKSGTPNAGTSCTPGSQEFDASKLYMCLTDSKWHTMSTASD